MVRDYQLFSSGLNNNPDLSALPNTHRIGKAASRYFSVWQFVLFNNQVPPSPTTTSLASSSGIPPWSSGNVSEMCYCGVPLHLWITIHSHSFGFAVTFGCLSRKTKDFLQSKINLLFHYNKLYFAWKWNKTTNQRQKTPWFWYLQDFNCICNEKLCFWRWLCHDCPKKGSGLYLIFTKVGKEASLFRAAGSIGRFQVQQPARAVPKASHSGHTTATKSQAFCCDRREAMGGSGPCQQGQLPQPPPQLTSCALCQGHLPPFL